MVESENKKYNDKSLAGMQFEKENIDIKKAQTIILFSLLDFVRATIQGAREFAAVLTVGRPGLKPRCSVGYRAVSSVGRAPDF